MDTFLFLAGGVVALIGTVIAISARHIFHAALGLAVALGGTAGLFVPLNGELISVIQILVYLGAVAIAIVFILMLSPPYYMARPRRNPFKMMAAAAIAVALVTPLGLKMLSQPNPSAPGGVPEVTVQRIGHAMLSDYLFPFEVIGLLLTVVIIGAIVLARDLPADRTGAESQPQQPEARS